MSAFTRFQKVIIRACGDNVVYLSIAVGVLAIITTLPRTILPFHQDLQISFHFLILIFQVLSHLFQYCLVHHHLVLRILMHGHHIHRLRLLAVISAILLIIYVKLFDRIFALGSKCAVLGVFCLVVYALLLITIPPFIQVII